MKKIITTIALVGFVVVPAFLTACGGADSGPTVASAQADKAAAPGQSSNGVDASKAPKTPIPLKEAKLNIEHNATDLDTGFQGAVDSEGWKQLDVRGPDGVVLTFKGRGELADLGLTELFFESVEPANADLPIEEMLAKLPEGDYTISGPGQENGESLGKTSGKAWLTHNIPAGPVLLSPAEGATIPSTGLVARWGAVTATISGGSVNIIAYQLIIEKDEPPHPHMIGKMGLSMYLPATTTSMEIPAGFLLPGTAYKWEVLAIEESGNQTLSSGAFQTQ